jgi:transposase
VDYSKLILIVQIKVLTLCIEQTITIPLVDYNQLVSISIRYIELEKRFVEMEKEVVALKLQIKLLKNGKDSNTSHTSPSNDIGRSNNKSLRSKGVNKTGGQQGHEGSTLLASTTPDKIIEHKEINYCSNCSQDIKDLPYAFIEKRQEVVIPLIVPEYVEHRCYRKICQCCGYNNDSKFPENITNNIQYGVNVVALVTYMHVFQFIPMARIANFLTSIFRLPLSEGTVDNMLNRMNDKATLPYEIIQKEVTQCNVVGSDETGSKIKGLKGWFHVWQTNKLTYIVASMSRGFSNVEKHFKDGFKNATLVSDCWAGQLKTAAKLHQLCIVHLLRELNNFIASMNDSWSNNLKLLFEKAITIKKASYETGLKAQESEIKIIKEKIYHLLDEPDNEGHKKIRALKKRLRKHKLSLLVFLDIEEVPFDNNGSERAIRNIKVKTKVSGGFRTLKGAERFAKIRSVVDTSIKNAQNVFEALINLAYYQPE